MSSPCYEFPRYPSGQGWCSRRSGKPSVRPPNRLERLFYHVTSRTGSSLNSLSRYDRGPTVCHVLAGLSGGQRTDCIPGFPELGFQEMTLDKLPGPPTRQWDVTENSPEVVDEVGSQEEQRGREIRPEPWESSLGPGGRCVTHAMPHAKVPSCC